LASILDSQHQRLLFEETENGDGRQMTSCACTKSWNRKDRKRPSPSCPWSTSYTRAPCTGGICGGGSATWSARLRALTERELRQRRDKRPKNKGKPF